MKIKGVIMTAFFGFILLSSTILFTLPGIDPNLDSSEVTITGTPADNYPDQQRSQFCGSSDAKSTSYVKEFSIPTLCTNPLAIVTDYEGNVWFVQTNTGSVAKFDPVYEQFTEYENPLWPKDGNSMMWGIDYAPDGSIWFTDDVYDSVWKFSISDEEYSALAYPSEGNALPQKLRVAGSQIIINDFTGNKLTFLDPTRSIENVDYLTLPSPVNGSFTASFAVDADDSVWYTNWIPEQGGVLIKFDQNDYRNTAAISENQFLPLLNFIEYYDLPFGLTTPNGVTVSDDGTVWLADTASSYFFSFDPGTTEFVQYVTSDPQHSTYGNQTGVIQNPISRPYWIESDSLGRIVFNEQTANNISVMDPKSQSLVQYHVPSKNPNWGDCDDGTDTVLADCGIAQIFDFTVDGEKIWFTEWVENNIGVVDTTVPLPLEIDLESDNIALSAGDSVHFNFIISPLSQDDLDVDLVLSTTSDFLTIELDHNSTAASKLMPSVPKPVHTNILVSEDAVPGTYKILFGAQAFDVAVGKYVTVTVE